MDYANMKSLLEDPDIQELLLVLGIFERRNESKNLTELCEHLDKMNQTMEQVALEVSGMREQLLQMNEKTSLKDSLSGIVEKMGEQALNMKIQLYDIGQEIKDKSKEVVQRVLNEGILGLRHMADFLGIKDKLISMRELAENSIIKTEEAITRIEQAAGQAGQAMVDVKNIGRSLSGKEMAEVNPGKQHRMERVVTAPMRARRTVISAMIGQIDRAIGSIDALLKGESVKEKQPEEIALMQLPKQELFINRQEERQIVN
ncbi:MAG: hypothetical protein LUE94_15755, partial [Clostridiales bacterium]|nr:hypothetical protein [Clostridiales bacterium]